MWGGSEDGVVLRETDRQAGSDERNNVNRDTDTNHGTYTHADKDTETQTDPTQAEGERHTQ